MSIAITAETAQIIQWLEPRKDVDIALRRVLENEIRRRLATYELTDRVFQRKYEMTLAEFEAANIVEKQGYSHEVESDHQDWDQAVDGIETLREALQKLQSQQ
jgi:DNA-binding TFAR19-related protein (PDSD5 family)